ncbi:MAG: hypothetical protein ACHBN1_32425 [Heteroscytonema crispum UTEX LB 1556]
MNRSPKPGLMPLMRTVSARMDLLSQPNPSLSYTQVINVIPDRGSAFLIDTLNTAVLI